MKAQNDIDVRISDSLYMQLFFLCCRCGESICSTGVANDYYYPLWFFENPIVPADEGYVCSECAGEANPCP